jgi:hypothetical protein
MNSKESERSQHDISARSGLVYERDVGHCESAKHAWQE